jgi:hypothetical protein
VVIPAKYVIFADSKFHKKPGLSPSWDFSKKVTGGWQERLKKIWLI